MALTPSNYYGLVGKPVQPNTDKTRYMFQVDTDELPSKPLTADDARSLLAENRRRAFQTTSRPVQGLDPATRSVLAYFEQVVLDHGCAVDTKVDRLDSRVRHVLRGYMESRARLAGASLTVADIDGLVDRVFNDMLSSLPAIDRALYAFDDELYDSVRAAIDKASLDSGGITRSDLRRAIGRNHVSYLRRVDEVIGQLLDSGEYGLVGGRLVAVARDSSTTERMHRRAGPRMGRPRKPDPEPKPIVRNLDGRLTDFIPLPNQKKDKEQNNDGDD